MLKAAQAQKAVQQGVMDLAGAGAAAEQVGAGMKSLQEGMA
jgi:hypothetical protein